MENFKKYYEFPLHSDGVVYIWTKDNGKALTFGYEEDFANSFQKSIAEVINGNLEREAVPYLMSHTFKYKSRRTTIVDENDKVFLIVRGWGHLTGCGGMNLPAEKAAVIQDEFGKYVVDKLNGK